jgi:hypothetical protein
MTSHTLPLPITTLTKRQGKTQQGSLRSQTQLIKTVSILFLVVILSSLPFVFYGIVSSEERNRSSPRSTLSSFSKRDLYYRYIFYPNTPSNERYYNETRYKHDKLSTVMAISVNAILIVLYILLISFFYTRTENRLLRIFCSLLFLGDIAWLSYRIAFNSKLLDTLHSFYTPSTPPPLNTVPSPPSLTLPVPSPSLASPAPPGYITGPHLPGLSYPSLNPVPSPSLASPAPPGYITGPHLPGPSYPSYPSYPPIL